MILVSVQGVAVRRGSGVGLADILDERRLHLHHLAATDAVLVVEVLLLEDGYDDVLGHEADETAGSVDYRVRVVVRLKSPLALFHIGNRGEHDGVFGHDYRRLQVLGRLGNLGTQEGHLLGAEGAVIEGATEEVADGTCCHDSNHHGQEDVNRRGGLEHDDDE